MGIEGTGGYSPSDPEGVQQGEHQEGTGRHPTQFSKMPPRLSQGSIAAIQGRIEKANTATTQETLRQYETPSQAQRRQAASQLGELNSPHTRPRQVLSPDAIRGIQGI